MHKILLLKDIWKSLYDPKANVSEIIDTFFHRDYEQCINGVYMDKTQYIQHVIEQKENVIIESIEYKYHIENSDELFALYYPKGKNKEGLSLEAEVIAYFCFAEQQILRIHGQVRLLEGNYADVDMTG